MNPNTQQNPPELIKQGIKELEAEISIRQAWVDSVLVLGGIQFQYDRLEADSKESSNRSSQLPTVLRTLAQARIAERQTNAGMMKWEIVKMQSKLEVYKQMLAEAEKQVVGVSSLIEAP
jgi:hypothetical protein